MWRITSIIDLVNDYDMDKLVIGSKGCYAVLFYNTVTKESEEMFIESGVGYFSCTVNCKKRKFQYYYEVMKFICSRYDWDFEHINSVLIVSDKYFMKVEEKLELLSPFKVLAVYRYGTNNSSVITLKDMFDLHKVSIKDGEVRVSDARFKLLCSEDEFKIAYTKYKIARGKVNVE